MYSNHAQTVAGMSDHHNYKPAQEILVLIAYA